LQDDEIMDEEEIGKPPPLRDLDAERNGFKSQGSSGTVNTAMHRKWPVTTGDHDEFDF
jgi:hypothetical protein